MFTVTLDTATLLIPGGLVVSAVIILMLTLNLRNSRPAALLSCVVTLAALAHSIWLFTQTMFGSGWEAFDGRLVLDKPALAFYIVILLGVFLSLLVSMDYVQRARLEHPEFYPLLLLSTTGALIMASANDLLVLLLGIEIMSLAVYVLAAWRQEAHDSEEAGMKYFLLGAFASAFLIYGIALSYGATGAFRYESIVSAISADGFNQLTLATLGMTLILAGLAFKVALAPFHQWAPDVYTGAPTAVTTYMSVVVKSAAFAALTRFVILFFPALDSAMADLYAVLIAITLIVANISALQQTRVKRLLAYSAVAHAGYIGMALLGPFESGLSAVIWYLTLYTFMTAGAFAILSLITTADDQGDTLSDLAGTASRRPWLAVALSICLLSLAGIPPLAGFIGKLFLFQAAIAGGYIWLAVIGILTSAVAVVYYARVIIALYSPADRPLLGYFSTPAYMVVFLAVAVNIVLGVLRSKWWYDLLTWGQQQMAGM